MTLLLLHWVPFVRGTGNSCYKNVYFRINSWNLHNVYWPLYEQMYREELQTQISQKWHWNSNYQNWRDHSTDVHKSSGKPWHNDDCKYVISKPKRAKIRINNQYPTSNNLDNFRVIRTKVQSLQIHFMLLFAVFYASLQNW